MDLDKRVQLDEEGFCVIPNLLPPDLRARLRNESNRILEALPKEHEEDNRSTGSMVSVYENAVCAELIAQRTHCPPELGRSSIANERDASHFRAWRPVAARPFTPRAACGDSTRIRRPGRAFAMSDFLDRRQEAARMSCDGFDWPLEVGVAGRGT